jgi:hypothetical protein
MLFDFTRRPIDVRPIQRPSGAGARGNRVVLCVVDLLVELHCEVGREAEPQRQPDVGLRSRVKGGAPVKNALDIWILGESMRVNF